VIGLVNVSRRLAVFLLPHDSYCAATKRCSCDRRRDGRLLASALTLPAGARASELPEAVLDVPAIAAAIRAGDLRVERPSTPTLPEAVIEGGPAGAPIPPIEVPDERRAPVVQGRRR
jgi:hypothetical protein